MKVLLIDDDRKLGELLREYLKGFDFELVHAETPSAGLEILRAQRIDAVTLDVMLPEIDGFEVCRKIRAFSAVPIIMLTARGEVTDRVLGLELGADDYLAKPFEPRELAARLKSLARRAREPKNTVARLRAGELVLDPKTRAAHLGPRDLELTSNEFAILKLFMEHPGQVLNRDRILETLRGVEWEAFNRSIDVAVSRLRQKLGDSPRQPKFFKTVWGEGYCFLATVEEET